MDRCLITDNIAIVYQATSELPTNEKVKTQQTVCNLERQIFVKRELLPLHLTRMVKQTVGQFSVQRYQSYIK